MTPYYERDGIQLFHCDCRELLPTLAAGSVDHCITDPPYGEETHANTRTRTVGAQSEKLVHFDSISAEQAIELFRELVRVTKRWVVASCEWRHAALFETAELPVVRLGVWVKPNGIPQLTGDRPGTGWEGVVMLHRRGQRTTWNGGGKRAVWNHNRVNAELHPTQKPLQLIEEWIVDFTDPAETIFDPFAGSGTTLVAAWRLGRKAIGCEISEQYCEVAAARLDREISQGRLFQPEPVKETQAALFGDAE